VRNLHSASAFLLHQLIRSALEKDMKNYLKIASMCIFALALTACNTIDGAGQDVEEAGETIQDAAN
tara:strand:- start:554 stop:751 length:198 start_codon:yes stop_codon:yes gene_type:complete